jgi:Raf kinase inhibitor-like YbhB/YbcL family protein
MAIHLVSTAFTEGGLIPNRFTCMGEDLSPPLSWSGVPAGTHTLALLCEDPDASAGIWVHWMLFNLPPDTSELHEGVPTSPNLQDGARQGMNSGHTIGYHGPCPPHGQSHRYIFRLYALDARVDLPASATRERFREAIEGHILDEGHLLGHFAR